MKAVPVGRPTLAALCLLVAALLAAPRPADGRLLGHKDAVVTPAPTSEKFLEELAGFGPPPTFRPTVDPWAKWATEEPTPRPPTVEPTSRPTASPTSPPPTRWPTFSPTDEPTARPTPGPTSMPTRRPTSGPTGKPTLAPTLEPFATGEPTARPTFGSTGEPTVRPGPPANQPLTPFVELDELVRVQLKYSPEGRLMNNLQKVVFEDVAGSFLSDLFRLTVPRVYDVEVKVTGQVAMDGRGRGRRLRRMQGTDVPLQVDLRVRGRFGVTDVHRAPEDVGFSSLCRNFFTVNGGVVVRQLGALAAQASDVGTTGVALDGTGLEYFGSVQEVRGMTLANSAGDGAGASQPSPKEEDGGASGEERPYIIAIVIGCIAFFGLVAAMIYVHRRSKSSPFEAKKNGEYDNGMKYPPPPKRSKKSAAADSMLSSRRASPSPINVPEEANSEQGSLAHVHTLGNDDYTYSDEVGGKARSFPGPLFARRSQSVPLGRKSPVYAESSAYADSSAYGDDDGMSQDLGGDEDSLFEDGETVMVMATPRGRNVFDKASVEREAWRDQEVESPSNAGILRGKNSRMTELSPSTAGTAAAAPQAADAIEDKNPPGATREYGTSARRREGDGWGASQSAAWASARAAKRKERDIENRKKAQAALEKENRRKAEEAAEEENRRKEEAAALSEQEKRKNALAANAAFMEENRRKSQAALTVDIEEAETMDTQSQYNASDHEPAWLHENLTDVLGSSSVAGSRASSNNSDTQPIAPYHPHAIPAAISEARPEMKFSIPSPSGGPDDDEMTVMTTVTKLEDAGMVKRDCYAPPGKLGVVIDSTSRGPVVHEVKAGTPLESVIFPGDRIIAIDGEDTRTLPASMVTKIMAAKKDQPRVLTVLSVMTQIG